MSSSRRGKIPPLGAEIRSVAALFAKRPRAFGHTAQTAAAPHSLAHLASVISEPTDVTAVGGVVTDQLGRWLRYERLMNQPEYKAIVGNKWYQLSVLNTLASITLPTGSFELKSAWKILTPAEIKGGRYYTTSATVYNTPGGAKSPGANPVTLGLVGLHIIHKTPTQSGFFWSTFEQVDNDKVFFNPNNHGTGQQTDGRQALHRTQTEPRADQCAGPDQAGEPDCGEPWLECLLPEAARRFGLRQLPPGQHAMADRRRAAGNPAERGEYRHRNLRSVGHQQAAEPFDRLSGVSQGRHGRQRHDAHRSQLPVP